MSWLRPLVRETNNTDPDDVIIFAYSRDVYTKREKMSAQVLFRLPIIPLTQTVLLDVAWK